MRRILALSLAAACVFNVQAAELQHVFVTYQDRLPAGIADELNLMGVPQGVVLPTVNAVALAATPDLIAAIAQDPRVKSVVPQQKLKLNLYSSVDQLNARGVDLPETIKAPSGKTLERPGVTGAGVKVAVIDSGVFALHPGLLGRVTTGLNFELSLLARELSGVLPAEVWDAYALGSGPAALQDEVGHGTHCAGIIGGDGTGASGLNLAGVAPGVEMISMKLASAANGVVVDVGFEANAVAAIDYLIRHNDELGVRVASNSWGILAEEAEGALGPTDYGPIGAVTKAAVDAGIVMVFAAGNDGGGPEQDMLRPVPNGLDEVITVASGCKEVFGSCEGGRVNGFSSRGLVTVTAPGDQILSAQSPSALAALGQSLEGDYFGDTPQDEAQNRALYMRLSGTSMATPHVSGVVALLLEANPALTPSQVKQILIDTAVDMAVDGDPELKPGYDKASGHGMVDVRAALAAATLAKAETKLEAAAAPAGKFGGAFSLLGLLLLAAPVLRRRA